MKLVMMAAALILGTTAIAQTTTPEEADTSTESTDTATDAMTQPDATTSIPPPASTTPTDTATDMAPPAAPAPMSMPRTVAAGNTAPETDARGIKVVSDSATAPAGYNEGARTVPAGSPMPTMAPPTPTASGPLPPCTRTVTDRCTQTYERGRAK